MKREIGRLAALLLGGIIVGYFLMAACYSIGPESFEGNLSDSIGQIAGETVRPIEPVSGRKLDNFTDALMLLELRYDGDESAFAKAVNTPYYTLRGSDPYGTLAQIDRRPKSFLQVNDYSRYWHGYQIVLRPLMRFFNYGQIRKINAVVLAVLITLVSMLMIDRAPRCVIPFLLSVFLFGPTAITQSLQYSSVTYITLLALLVILWNPGKIIEKGKAHNVFMLSGMAAAYFDLLTFPTVTLTMPLVLLYALGGENRRFKGMLACAACWIVGYAGMWAGKWLIAFAFNGTAFLDSLFSQMKFRAGATDWDATKVTRVGTVVKNIREMFEGHACIDAGILCCAIACLARGVRGLSKMTRQRAKNLAVGCVPALIALGWIVALANHSRVHTFFTYRTLVPCVFCLLCTLGVNGSRPIPSDSK